MHDELISIDKITNVLSLTDEMVTNIYFTYIMIQSFKIPTGIESF